MALLKMVGPLINVQAGFEMPTVVFQYPNGVVREMEIEVGLSLMEGAVNAGVDGIDADCGGALACATCHVRVSEEWRSRLKPPSRLEVEMLGCVVAVDEGSRLSCQIKVLPELDGIRVTIPETQR